MLYKLVVPGPMKGVSELRVLEWHGVVGSAFETGALIVELETHKAIVEVRASQPGILRDIVSGAGSWQRIGKALAVLSDDPAEPLPSAPEELEALPVEFEVS